MMDRPGVKNWPPKYCAETDTTCEQTTNSTKRQRRQKVENIDDQRRVQAERIELGELAHLLLLLGISSNIPRALAVSVIRQG